MGENKYIGYTPEQRREAALNTIREVGGIFIPGEAYAKIIANTFIWLGIHPNWGANAFFINYLAAIENAKTELRSCFR